jgi:hypothetical protein
MPISENDIKSELSYAYFHAVAARAGCSCQCSNRLTDNMGIDVDLKATGQFSPPPARTVLSVYVQLKATSQKLPVKKGKFSLRIEKSQYNKMRITTVSNQWILVLFILPEISTSWLKCSPHALTMKKCAYWVSLRDAPPPPSGPDDKMTIHVPQRNRFTVEAINEILARCAREDLVVYDS